MLAYRTFQVFLGYGRILTVAEEDFTPHHCTHAAIAAWFELFPESLHVGQVQLVEGDGHLSNGVVPAEPVVVQNLQV